MNRNTFHLFHVLFERVYAVLCQDFIRYCK